MSDAPKIEPALTAEEWEQRTYRSITGREFSHIEAQGVQLHDNGVMVLVGLDDDRDINASPAALIALANAALPDSDPRKITREKIEHMKAIAESIRPTTSNESHIGFLEEFATALESYLPP